MTKKNVVLDPILRKSINAIAKQLKDVPAKEKAARKRGLVWTAYINFKSKKLTDIYSGQIPNAILEQHGEKLHALMKPTEEYLLENDVLMAELTQNVTDFHMPQIIKQKEEELNVYHSLKAQLDAAIKLANVKFNKKLYNYALTNIKENIQDAEHELTRMKTNPKEYAKEYTKDNLALNVEFSRRVKFFEPKPLKSAPFQAIKASPSFSQEKRKQPLIGKKNQIATILTQNNLNDTSARSFGTSLLAIQGEDKNINKFFNTLADCLSLAPPNKHDLIIQNAKRIMLYMIEADRKNTFLPNFNDKNSFSPFFQKISKKLSREIKKQDYDSFFKYLGDTQNKNITRENEINTRVHQITANNSNQFRLSSFLTITLNRKDITDKELDDIAKLVANDLKSLSIIGLLTIPTSDFYGKAWEKKENTLKQVQRAQDTVTKMIINDILSGTTPTHQIKIAEFYVKILQHALNNKDFATGQNVLLALESTPIKRLDYIQKNPAIAPVVTSTSRLMTYERNFAEYRSALENSKAHTEPVVPFLGLFTKDYLFADDGSPNTKNGDLNLNKVELLMKPMGDFLYFQSKAASHPTQPLSSDIFQRTLTSTYDEKKTDQRSQESYRKIKFERMPSFAELVEKIASTKGQPIILTHAFSLDLPNMIDIIYKDKILNHKTNSKKSILLILAVINKSTNSSQTLSEKIVANNLLEKIKSNIQNNPEIKKSLTSIINRTQKNLGLSQKLLADLNLLNSATKEYHYQQVREKTINLKINTLETKIANYQTEIAENTYKIAALDERNDLPELIEHERSVLQHNIQRLNNNVAQNQNLIKGLKGEILNTHIQKNKLTNFVSSLEQSHKKLASIQKTELTSAISEVGEKLALLEKIERHAVQYQEKVERQHTLTSNDRIKQLVTLRHEIESLENEFREHAKNADPIIKAASKTVLEHFNISPSLKSNHYFVPWKKAAATPVLSQQDKSTNTPLSKPKSR